MTINTRPIMFIPQSKNFSEFNTGVPEENNEDKPLEYEASDGGAQAQQMLSNLQADTLLLELLSNLDDREKIIFLYQVLREAGYNLQHEECARTLSISRGGYIIKIKKVKAKCLKILQANLK